MLLPTLFVACLFRIVAAATNITVDDNSPSITYHPAFSWKETPFDPLNFGGQHRVTSNPSATATFNFTGVAIYFYSPLWPFQVNTAISIDGQSPIFVDLTDYTQTPFVVDGPETVASDVVWDATGLDNKEHTLVVSVALGQQHAVVDGLVYTVPDPDDVTTTSESAAPTTTSLLPIPSSTQTPAAASSTSPGARRGLSIALGIVCTTFALLVAWAAYWYWKRRRRLAAEEEFYRPRTDGPPPEMSSVPSARPKYVRTRPIENPFLAPSSSGSSNSSGSSRRHRPSRPKAHLSTIPETRDDSRPTSASYSSRTRVSSPLRNQVEDDDTSDDQDRDFPQPSVRLVSHN